MMIREMRKPMMISLMKTGTYGVMHVTVATSLAYMLTGNLITALSIGLLEPAAQTVFFFFHEQAWAKAVLRAAGK